MNETQLEQLQNELKELQTYLKEVSGIYTQDAHSTQLTRWANTIGTTRLLLDVFSNGWEESLSKGISGVETPGKTSGTCNDFG